MVAAAHRAGARGPSRDHQRLSESRRDRGARPRPAQRIKTKTGHFRGGVHRPRRQNRPLRAPEVSTDSACVRPRRAARRARARASRIARSSPRRSRVAATPWRSGRTWSTTTAFRRGTRASAASSWPLRGRAPADARVVITTAPGEEGQVDYGEGPMVRDRGTGKYRRTRLFVLTLGYSRKSVRLLVWRSSAQVWAELHERAFRRLGGTVRVIVLDNLKRRRAHAGHLRPRAQSALSRRARALRRRRAAVPRRRSRSQRQSRSRRRSRAEDAAARPPLRDARGGASVSRSLGDALGRHAHPRHDEAPGRRDVCRGAARARPTPARTVSLLPLRRPHGPSRWLRRSRGRVLRRAARLDRPARPGAMERSHVRLLDPKTGQLLREHLRAPRGWHRHRTTPIDRARTPPSTVALLARAKTRRPAHQRHLRSHPSARRRSGRPTHPRRPGAREETRPGGRR